MDNRKVKTFPTFSLVLACEQALLSGYILRGHARVTRETRRDVLAHMIDFSCLLLLFSFCSAGLPRVAEVFSRVRRLSSSEMLRGRSEADTSSNLKPRFNMSLAPRVGRGCENGKIIVKYETFVLGARHF